MLAVAIFDLMAVVDVSAADVSDEDAIDGFYRTVFVSEYSSGESESYVRKFNGTVRFHVRSEADAASRSMVEDFILRLPQLITGLQVRLVKREPAANFVVHIVPRAAYAQTVRERVYKRASAPVRGVCMVRSRYTRRGIQHSDAVIVSNAGEMIFQRCMIEEILQGLGPLNDDPTLTKSMFNDQSRFSSIQPFDLLILNMLYDPLIVHGATQAQIQSVLPIVLGKARNSLGKMGW